MSQRQTAILKEGLLQRKTKQLLLTVWKQFYFVLSDVALQMCKYKGAKVSDKYPLSEVSHVRALPATDDVKSGKKSQRVPFDIELLSGEILHLAADTEEQAHSWVVAISNSVFHAAQQQEARNRMLSNTDPKPIAPSSLPRANSSKSNPRLTRDRPSDASISDIHHSLPMSSGPLWGRQNSSSTHRQSSVTDHSFGRFKPTFHVISSTGNVGSPKSTVGSFIGKLGSSPVEGPSDNLTESASQASVDEWLADLSMASTLLEFAQAFTDAPSVSDLPSGVKPAHLVELIFAVNQYRIACFNGTASFDAARSIYNNLLGPKAQRYALVTSAGSDELDRFFNKAGSNSWHTSPPASIFQESYAAARNFLSSFVFPPFLKQRSESQLSLPSPILFRYLPSFSGPSPTSSPRGAKHISGDLDDTGGDSPILGGSSSPRNNANGGRSLFEAFALSANSQRLVINALPPLSTIDMPSTFSDGKMTTVTEDGETEPDSDTHRDSRSFNARHSADSKQQDPGMPSDEQIAAHFGIILEEDGEFSKLQQVFGRFLAEAIDELYPPPPPSQSQQQRQQTSKPQSTKPANGLVNPSSRGSYQPLLLSPALAQHQRLLTGSSAAPPSAPVPAVSGTSSSPRNFDSPRDSLKRISRPRLLSKDDSDVAEALPYPAARPRLPTLRKPPHSNTKDRVRAGRESPAYGDSGDTSSWTFDVPLSEIDSYRFGRSMSRRSSLTELSHSRRSVARSFLANHSVDTTDAAFLLSNEQEDVSVFPSAFRPSIAPSVSGRRSTVVHRAATPPSVDRSAEIAAANNSLASDSAPKRKPVVTFGFQPPSKDNAIDQNQDPTSQSRSLAADNVSEHSDDNDTKMSPQDSDFAVTMLHILSQDAFILNFWLELIQFSVRQQAQSGVSSAEPNLDPAASNFLRQSIIQGGGLAFPAMAQTLAENLLHKSEAELPLLLLRYMDKIRDWMKTEYRECLSVLSSLLSHHTSELLDNDPAVATSMSAAAVELVLRVLFIALQQRNHNGNIEGHPSTHHAPAPTRLSIVEDIWNRRLSMGTTGRASVTSDTIAQWACAQCAKTGKQFANYIRTQTHIDTIIAAPVDPGSSAPTAPYLVESLKCALLTILLYPTSMFHSVPAPKARLVVFGGTVYNPPVWHSIYVLLSRADPSRAKELLHDITALLIRRQFNCASIAGQQHWQDFMMPLIRAYMPPGMTGVFVKDEPVSPKSTQSEPVPIQVFRYAFNIFITLHYHVFTQNSSQSNGFADLFIASCRFLQEQMRNGVNALLVIRSFLQGLIAKTQANKKDFPSTFVHQNTWTNLQHLVRVLKIYLLSTPTLGTSLPSEDDEDEEMRARSGSLEENPLYVGNATNQPGLAHTDTSLTINSTASAPAGPSQDPANSKIPLAAFLLATGSTNSNYVQNSSGAVAPAAVPYAYPTVMMGGAAGGSSAANAPRSPRGQKANEEISVSKPEPSVTVTTNSESRTRALTHSVRFGDMIFLGPHVDQSGKCVDYDLVCMAVKLLKVLFHPYKAATADSSSYAFSNKGDREYMLWLEQEIECFSDLQSLFGMLEPRLPQCTRSEITQYCSVFISGDSKGRSRVFQALNSKPAPFSPSSRPVEPSSPKPLRMATAPESTARSLSPLPATSPRKKPQLSPAIARVHALDTDRNAPSSSPSPPPAAALSPVPPCTPPPASASASAAPSPNASPPPVELTPLIAPAATVTPPVLPPAVVPSLLTPSPPAAPPPSAPSSEVKRPLDRPPVVVTATAANNEDDSQERHIVASPPRRAPPARPMSPIPKLSLGGSQSNLNMPSSPPPQPFRPIPARVASAPDPDSDSEAESRPAMPNRPAPPRAPKQ